MPQQYMNPMGMMPNSQEFGGDTSVLGMMNAFGRQNMSMPFIEQARQQQDMETQKQRMQLQEAQSPQAMAMRQAEIQRKTAEDQAKTIMAPQQLKKELAQVKADLESMPSITAEKIAKAEQATLESKGKPAGKFLGVMGQMASQIQQLPENSRQMAWKQGIEQIKSMMPGAQLPAGLENYSPEKAKMLHYMAIYTAEHQQSMQKEGMKQEGADRRAVLQANTALEGHRIDATSREAVAAGRVHKTAAAAWAAHELKDDGLRILRIQATQSDSNTPEGKMARERYERERKITRERVVKDWKQNSATDASTIKEDPQTRAAVEQAGYQYEPETYDYKVEGGKVYRKQKKGK